MKQYVVIQNNRWFEELFREISSWPDVTVIDPMVVDYREADNADVHYHIWGQFQWFAVANRLPKHRSCHMTLRYIEQIPTQHISELRENQRALFQRFLSYIDYFDEIYVTSRAGEAFLQSIRPDAKHKFVQHPSGYTSFYGAPNFGCPQDVDVLFYGAPTIRRLETLYLLQQNLRGLKTVGLYDAWGNERNQMLHRTKIDLNVHQVTGQFPAMRMWRALANGALWITEAVGDSYPLAANEDFVMVDTITSENVEAVCEILRYWIDHPVERSALRMHAHEKAKQHSMRRYFDEICRRAEDK